MGQNIVFNSMELISAVFYCFGIIIPTICLLYNIGNLVFTVGEYKESDKTIPLILLLLSIKIFVISFALFFAYHTIFDINFYVGYTIPTVTIFFWGLLIICDTCISNKLMGLINRYIPNNNNFKTYLKRGISIIYKRVPYCFYGKILFSSVLIFCTLMNIICSYVHIYETIIILNCLFIIYLWISYKITKYFKKLNTLC